jgi:hypothetical protein
MLLEYGSKYNNIRKLSGPIAPLQMNMTNATITLILNSIFIPKKLKSPSMSLIIWNVIIYYFKLERQAEINLSAKATTRSLRFL